MMVMINTQTVICHCAPPPTIISWTTNTLRSLYSPNNPTVCNYHFIFTQKSLSPSGWWSNLPRSTQASLLSNQDLPWVRAKSQPWELSVFVCFFLFTSTHPNNLCFIMWTQVPLTTLPILPDAVSGIATDTLAYRSGKKSLHGMNGLLQEIVNVWCPQVLKVSGNGRHVSLV